MDNCHIGEETIIDNCCIGKDVRIEKGMKLYNCYIGDNFHVLKNDSDTIKDVTLSDLDNQIKVIRKMSENKN